MYQYKYERIGDKYFIRQLAIMSEIYEGRVILSFTNHMFFIVGPTHWSLMYQYKYERIRDKNFTRQLTIMSEI